MSKLVDKVKLVVRMCADKRIKDCDFRVAVALILSFLNTTTGQCNPSRRKVAAASTKHRATVIEATTALQALGYVVVDGSDGGRNKRNHYSFNMEETVASDDRLGDDAKLTPSDETVAASDINGRRGRPQTVANDDTHITQEINTGRNTGSASDEARSQESFEREITEQHLTIAAEKGLSEQEAREEFTVWREKQEACGGVYRASKVEDLRVWMDWCEYLAEQKREKDAAA